MIANLLAASGQAAVVVAVASLLLWLLRVNTPGVRYAFWRTVALLCLILPFVQPYRRWSGSASAADVLGIAVTASPSSTVASAATAYGDRALIVMLAIAAGALLRLAWLSIGLIRLRHLRRAGVAESRPQVDGDLQQTLGTRAELRYSARVTQPVTFGLIRPVVLLPDSLRTQPLEIQRAVVGHELIHVKRRDWGWLLVEEVGLSLLWFHPAAWWVASRIQLAREEVVDDFTVLLTGRRKSYVEALLAFADPLTVVPTAAFARRRHLLRRIALISREDSMSSRRIIASCAVMALVVPLGTWGAVSAFPLHARNVQATQLPAGPGPLELRARTATPENPVPRRVHYEPPTVPDIAEKTSAKIVVKVTLDSAGTVAEARPTGIAVKGSGFDIEAEGVKLSGTASLGPGSPSIDATVRETVLALIDSAVTSVKQWRYDPPAEAPLTFSISIRYGDEPEQMAFSPKPKEDNALRVGGAIKAPEKIKDVRAIYPPDALAAGIEGTVILEVKVDAQGRVAEAHVLKSIPALDQAALDAVRQWEFQPPLLNGQPTAVIMTTTISFQAK